MRWRAVGSFLDAGHGAHRQPSLLPNRLGKGFGRDPLRRPAGARSFERGLEYLSSVSALEIGEKTATASVDGTEIYEVELTEHEDGLTGCCDCPYGREGNFCKHCVAVGLTVLQQSESVPKHRAAAASRSRQLTTWLETRSRGELLALVKEHIAADHDLRRRLELRASTADDDPSAVRERFLTLLDTRPFARYGYVEYADARAYGLQAAEAVSVLRNLTATGRATEAVDMAREAVEALARTYGEIDDSDGVIGNVADGLAAAHLEACLVAHPDPSRTADWLVDHLLSDLGHATDILLSAYADVLKSTGMAGHTNGLRQPCARTPRTGPRKTSWNNCCAWRAVWTRSSPCTPRTWPRRAPPIC